MCVHLREFFHSSSKFHSFAFFTSWPLGKLFFFVYQVIVEMLTRNTINTKFMIRFDYKTIQWIIQHGCQRCMFFIKKVFLSRRDFRDSSQYLVSMTCMASADDSMCMINDCISVPVTLIPVALARPFNSQVKRRVNFLRPQGRLVVSPTFRLFISHLHEKRWILNLVGKTENLWIKPQVERLEFSFIRVIRLRLLSQTC